ncbi:MAG: threonine ammonia-lyase [Gemmatimonadota bacterium]
MVDLEDIRAAREVVYGALGRTPLLRSTTLGERAGVDAYLKAENLQRTGSFKTRGATVRVSHLNAAERARGLVAVSAGNHAQAVAYAASAAGVRATVVMPETAPRAKVEASRGYGAEVVLHGTVYDAFDKADELSRERGLVYVHPFDDPHIIAGQGSVGLEILEDLPDVDAIVVCVGGGGLIAGIATAVKSLRPGTRVIGVEPTGAACVAAGLRQGSAHFLDAVTTIADGLATPTSGDLVLEHLRAYVDDMVLVDDEEIVEGMRFLLQRAKLLAEPAGAAAVAAVLAGKVDLPPGGRVAVTVSGGNIDLGRLSQYLEHGPPDA